MRSRPIHLAVLVFQFFWLNVLVPGHQRGIVQLPGATHCLACCPFCAAADHGRQHGEPTKPANNCAICSFMAHLHVPPPVDFSHAPLELLHRLSDQKAAVFVARCVLAPFDCRGPPVRADFVIS